MKLFTVGPVSMYPEVNKVHMDQMVYFRTDEFSTLVKENIATLAGLLDTDYPSGIIYLTASGTAAMEAVITNCLKKDDNALVVNGGTFGRRFCELLQYHKINYDSIDLEWNETLTEAHLNQKEGKKYSVFLVNLHETSTGQLYDIELIKKFCQKNDILLVVDAISTFLADDFSMRKNGIDVAIISSQKGLCLSAGLAFVAMSERMTERCRSIEMHGDCYFRFIDYLANMERGQTPYTPAVSIMYELKAMLALIESKGGKSAWLNEVWKKAQYFREKAYMRGLIIPEYPLSCMLTPVVFTDVDARKIFIELKNKYSIYVNPCGGANEKRMFRVSHIGNTTLEDFDDLLDKIELSISTIKCQEV